MKKCPVCQEALLHQKTLENGLPAYECGRCEGIWISSNEYLHWLKTQTIAPEIEPVEIPFPISDTKKAILCPDCGRILRRYKIWPDIEFHLDRCRNCNGVWFDRNEWQALKLHNLHDKVNIFFTEPWQNKLRTEEVRRRFEKMYLDKFGQDDYTEIKRLKAWLAKHPQRAALLAYLTDEDPYRG